MSRKKGDAVALRKKGTEVDLAGDGIALAVGALDFVAEDSALPLVNIIEKVRGKTGLLVFAARANALMRVLKLGFPVNNKTATSGVT